MMEDNRLQLPVNEEELSAFIGRNAQKYLLKFRKFSADGFDRFSATWHWPAFLVGFWWLLYRKMYLWALGYFILLIIPYVNIAAWITLAVSGNYLYYRHAKSEIERVKTLQPSGDILKILSGLGGVNKWVPVAGIIVSVASFFMFLLGLLLSAC
jgi:hypothetical protein